MTAPTDRPSTATPPGLLPDHWAELQASAIPADLAARNVASFGPGTIRDWEAERAELVAHARLEIQTASTTASGHPQAQPGFLADRLIGLQQRYQHLRTGGWRSLSDTLPDGPPVFDQWKPDAPRQKPGRPDERIRYEAPPSCPDGGGLLLPRVPERHWRLICDRQGIRFPAAATRARGFWWWAMRTPGLQLVIVEGWKKALAAIAAGHAAVALPGVTMGRRVTDGRDRLIPALAALTVPGRRWRIVFDAEARPKTARKVGGAAKALARCLRAAGAQATIARLPLLPGTAKTGLDDLLAAAGAEALAAALTPPPPRPVLPEAPASERVAAAGQWLGVACPMPTPEAAPLVILRAPMGCGKTEAIAAAIAPLQAAGVPILTPWHRQALGQAGAERLGVPWRPTPGSDERQQGIASCWDSWWPDSGLRISGTSYAGGVLVADEWMQALEHLLMSNGTALAKRHGCRGSVLRTIGEQLPRMRQVIASDAQMADWAVRLLERLSGRKALVIGSAHRPMLGRPLYCPEGFTTPQAAGIAFKAQWAQLVADRRPFLCWTTAQKGQNSPQALAELHRKRVPGAHVLVLDSTTPEATAELAADPDGVAARFDAVYASPALSSGISFCSWRPAAVIAFAGGLIAPEHAAQALARVRCPEVPAWIFAPERCPGIGLRVGSGSTDPTRLIADLQAAAVPLLRRLVSAGDEWLTAWGELGAVRNRQREAYRATIAGLLQAEGWELAAAPLACPTAGAVASAALREIATNAQEAEDRAVMAAPLLSPTEAEALSRHRRRTPADRAALSRYQLAERWGLGDAPPTQAVIDADRDGLRERLRLGWLLQDREALALVRDHDRQQLEALAPSGGGAFAPDALRLALTPKLAELVREGPEGLGLLQLLQRFRDGEVIAADDPAVEALHAATVRRAEAIRTAVGVSPAAKPTGTLRALLQAIGWKLQHAGRIKARRAGSRDAYTYRAAPVPVPEGVDLAALQAAWWAQLVAPLGRGAKSPPTGVLYREVFGPTPPPPLPEGERIGPRLRARMGAVPISFEPGQATASSTAPGAALAATFRLSAGPAAAIPPPSIADPP